MATTTTTVGPAVRLRQKYERLLRPQTALTDANATATLNVMRRLILLEGLPPMTAVRPLGRPQLQGGSRGSWAHGSVGRASGWVQQEREDRQGTLCSLRGRVWKALLAVNTVSADAYIALVERGPSAVHEKIRYGRCPARPAQRKEEWADPCPRVGGLGCAKSNDGFRTFATDVNFKERVTEDQLVRVLNAYAQRPGPSPGPQICVRPRPAA